MPLVVPERTIDSMFTFELISAAPTAIVISPNNNSGPRTPDHELRNARRKFVFECKTLYTAASGASNWVVRVPIKQLADYVAHGQPSLIYVLPASPTVLASPWIRTCGTDPDPRGWCKSCSNPRRGYGAVYVRRWAGKQEPIASASPETRLQPWFNHWAWCVPADSLLHYLKASSTLVRPLSGTPTAEISASDSVLATITGAVRFCHFLRAIKRDHDEIHDLDVTVDGEEEILEIPPANDGFEALERMSVESVAELEPFEDDRRLVVGY